MPCLHCIYVFCVYLRTNSDLCHLQHKLIGFYNRDVKFLQRGTDWVFKYSSLRFVFKWLKKKLTWYTAHNIFSLDNNEIVNRDIIRVGIERNHNSETISLWEENFNPCPANVENRVSS